MSLHPHAAYPVPEETQRVARAAFPRGNGYRRVIDTLGALYQDESFAGLFPARGQPAVSPARLALVTVLQFAEGLSDRQEIPVRIGPDGSRLSSHRAERVPHPADGG